MGGMWNELGRVILLVGAVLVVVGLVLVFADRIPFLGRLPGDIVVRRKNFTLYFPIATGILLSIVLTIVLNLISRR
jgi:hypothetical protein